MCVCVCVSVCLIIQPYIYHLVYTPTRYLFWEKLATKPEYLHCKPWTSTLRLYWPKKYYKSLRWPSYFWGTAVSLKIVSGLKTNWINVRHWLFFGSKNLFKSFRFLNLSYFSVLRYRVVVPSFIGSAKEGKPLPPYLLECFFPTVDFNIQPHLILIFSLR